MTFNELNSVEHFIIHNLTGVNLNNVRGGMVKVQTREALLRHGQVWCRPPSVCCVYRTSQVDSRDFRTRHEPEGTGIL